MPTVVREDGFSIRVYAPPREHPPPHVHVYKAGNEVVIELVPVIDMQAVREVYAMSLSDVSKAIRLVKHHEVVLIAAWESLHGKESAD